MSKTVEWIILNARVSSLPGPEPRSATANQKLSKSGSPRIPKTPHKPPSKISEKVLSAPEYVIKISSVINTFIDAEVAP